jgi:MFS superfamily sulfate permease-like transporter
VYDLAAGAAVSAMIVPHSLAMAILAGLPPVYGLYSSWVCFPCFVFVCVCVCVCFFVCLFVCLFVFGVIVV